MLSTLSPWYAKHKYGIFTHQTGIWAGYLYAFSIYFISFLKDFLVHHPNADM
jgi:hypothetical protein